MRDIQGNDPSLTSFADLGSKKGAIIYLNFTLQSYSLKEYKLSELVQQSLNARRCSNMPSVLLSGSDWEELVFRCTLTLDMSFTASRGYSRLRRACLPEKKVACWSVQNIPWASPKGHIDRDVKEYYTLYVCQIVANALEINCNQSLYVEKVPWSRSRGGGRALSGYLLDHRQPLHYYCKLYNVYCVGQYILCCIQ